MSFLQRAWKPLLAAAAVVIAFTVTFVYPERNGLEIDIDGSPRAQAARNRDPYDLTQLQVLNRAILEVKDHYVEPERIDARRMLLAGLNSIQRAVPPVLVHYENGGPELTVQVDTKKETFQVGEISSPWTLASAFRDIFAFLQEHLAEEDIELRDVEYAAANGVLHTLDPHSVLLTPDVFEEMQMSTRGEFGGLGIVISLREGHLTVIRPMPNTPASRAGLEPGDRIVKIGSESTINMPLSEAVDRLRGAPGSKVTVWVRHQVRKGTYSPPRKHEIVRAVIHIESVESRMLDDGVGYLKINNFQGNTYEDMRRSLQSLHKEGLEGLVLDLRDNPGGLLEQAVRVADAFLPNGIIVTTSSNDPEQQDKKFARREGTEPNYPMVVLVNGSSASASEIVAGALKNHDRALVVGKRTFGKGSVQVLYNFQDGAALKLTIAQYLTPGDVSIQGVGIVPDVAIDPMTVDREDMDLAVDKDYLREADLNAHLTHERARETEKPQVVLRYYLPAETRQRLREAEPDDVEENEEEDEFLTKFSQMLLAKATASNRRAMLDEARPVIDRMGDEEMDKAIAELRKLGVDWSVGEDGGGSDVKVEATTNQPDNRVTAGEPFELRVKATNEGDQTLYRLRATTESDFGLFDDRELVFGKLEPGQSREWSTTLGICETENGKRQCRVPMDTMDRADAIRIEFDEAHGHTPEATEVRTHVEALPRPQFAYSLQVADNVQGNHDGHVQRGEHVSMYLLVRNVGEGRAYETQANLRNLSGEGILLQDGRFQLEGLAPGEERLVEFTFEVLPNFDRDEVKLEVSVADRKLRESFTEQVVVPLAEKESSPRSRRGRVMLPAGTELREGPSEDAPVLARVNDPVTLDVRAELDGFLRVELDDDRPGWVRASEADEARGVRRGSVEFDINHMPPQLEVDHGGRLVTREPHIQLRGRATDEQKVRDLYIFVDARKVFYKSNQGSGSPRELEFDTRIPLHGGINHVTVFARERDDVVTRQMLVIRRDAPDGSLMETPRFDSDLFGMEVDQPPEQQVPAP
ncbi:MAG: MXAN_5808 family serine peptidase [Myxococcota bacterium]